MPNRNAHFSLLGLALTLLAVGLCLSLSWWQWQRAEEKRQWLADQVARASADPVNLDRALSLDDPQYRPVNVSGQFDNRRSVLLDNRTYNGVAGYFLLTPLHTQEGHWVLINRGWLPRGADRNQLPTVPTISGQVTLTGQAYQPSARALILKETPLPENQWPLRVQKVDFETIGQRLGVELVPFEIRVAADQSLGGSDSMPRPWQDISALISPERHQAYALQWLGLAIAAAIMYLVARLRGRRRHQPDA